MWDGINEEPYTDDTTWHDCIIMGEMELVSIQKRRREMLDSNVVPTVVFACKSGKMAFEAEFNGEIRGIQLFLACPFEARFNNDTPRCYSQGEYRYGAWWI